MKPEHIGAAGEYRVMSELLLRGWNPARHAFDIGVDILLPTGVTIQVKTVSRPHGGYYAAQLGHTGYRQTIRADYVIVWGIEDDCFYVIPREVNTGNSTIAVPSLKIRIIKNSKYRQYLDRWDLLGVPPEEGKQNLDWEYLPGQECPQKELSIDISVQ